MIGALLTGGSLVSSAQGLMSHDFDDNTMGPFVHCTTKSPNYAKPVDGRLKTYWIESSYDGGRSTKGAEACGNTDANGVGYLTVKHCWLGFTMNLDKDYIANNDTQAGLMQVFGFDPRYGMSSWTAMFDFNEGDLTWVDRTDQGMAKTYGTIMENVPKGEDLDVIVHVVLSKSNKGTVEVFIDGDLKYSRYNTNVGMGDFNSNDEQDWTSVTEFKIGQYNYENPKYTPGEERVVYYDNISWYDQSDGYDVVDPSGDGGAFTPDPNKTYYVDCPRHDLRLAATGSSEDAYTTSTSTTGADVEWKFVDKGNGYWHIDRAAGGKKSRLRTDNSSNADMQRAASTGTKTYYDFSAGAFSGSYFLTLADGPSNHNRLQVNSSGEVKMVKSSDAGSWESFRITEVENAQGDESGLVPGMVEAEDYFDAYDTTSGNSGKEYREDDVDIQTTADSSGGYNVGWTADGEWLDYKVDVLRSGSYDIEARVSSPASGVKKLGLELDGKSLGQISVLRTGNWKSFETVALENVALTAGEGKTLRLNIIGGSFNINHLNFIEKEAWGGGVNYSVTKDAYVRGGEFADTNYGSDKTLDAKNNSNSKYDRNIYAQFNITNRESFSKVDLVLPIRYNSGPGTLALYAVSDDSWSESGITWNNKPALGELLTTFSIEESDVESDLMIDVTDYAMSEAAKDGQASFALVRVSGTSKIVRIQSKEDIKGMQLDVSY